MGPMSPIGLMSLLSRRRRGSERAGLDLLEIAYGMLLAGANEEDDGDQNECRQGFHEAEKAIGARPDCNPSFSACRGLFKTGLRRSKTGLRRFKSGILWLRRSFHLTPA